MENIFETLTSNYGKNKKIIMLAVIIYIIITIGIIVVIWWPDNKDYLEYNNIDMTQKQEELAQNYIDNISLLFRTGDKQAIKNLISEEYVNYTGKSKDEIIKELDNNGFFSLYSEIKGVKLYVDESTYVYTTTIYYKDNKKSVNIVETYPHKYKIVFDDFYKYNKVQKITTNQGIKFTVDDIYRNLNYIELNVKIENQNNSYVRFDFNNPTCVQAVLKDGKLYSISNLVSTSQYTDIEPNTTITKNILFTIPAQLQNNIDYIVFNNVVLEFSKANIKVQI